MLFNSILRLQLNNLSFICLFQNCISLLIEGLLWFHCLLEWVHLSFNILFLNYLWALDSLGFILCLNLYLNTVGHLCLSIFFYLLLELNWRFIIYLHVVVDTHLGLGISRFIYKIIYLSTIFSIYSIIWLNLINLFHESICIILIRLDLWFFQLFLWVKWISHPHTFNVRLLNVYRFRMILYICDRLSLFNWSFSLIYLFRSRFLNFFFAFEIAVKRIVIGINLLFSLIILRFNISAAIILLMILISEIPFNTCLQYLLTL